MLTIDGPWTPVAESRCQQREVITRTDDGKVKSIEATLEARAAQREQDKKEKEQEHSKREAEIVAVADELTRRERAKKPQKCPKPLKF